MFQRRGHITAVWESDFGIWSAAASERNRAVADAPIIERRNPSVDPGTDRRYRYMESAGSLTY